MTKNKKDDKIVQKSDKKKTDPQENMQGPISSLVQGVKKEVEKGNEETKEEADKKKEANL